MVPLMPGSSWTSPGETAKFCTTMTCGRGSGALVSIWLEPWVQAASNVSPHGGRQAHAGPGETAHPFCPRCGPVIDTRLSWPPASLLKLKNRVLKPWHWLPPRRGLSSKDVK